VRIGYDGDPLGPCGHGSIHAQDHWLRRIHAGTIDGALLCRMFNPFLQGQSGVPDFCHVDDLGTFKDIQWKWAPRTTWVWNWCGIAEHDNVDMIVIATHGMSGWRRIAFGSVAQKVVEQAPLPGSSRPRKGRRPFR
jgi:Universal stress protein family